MNTLILIDDSDDQLELMQLALAALRRAPPARVYRDGHLAVTDLATGDCKPDLILVDVNMPGLDGPDTVARLRALPHLRHTPILMLSTSDLAQDQHRAREAGADGYLRKPHGGLSWRDVMHQAGQVHATLRGSCPNDPSS